MWPWGHVAVAYLCWLAYARIVDANADDGIAVVILTFGALFPDLVDKPLAWYVGILPTGRSLAHSLLLLVPLSLIVYGLARRHDRREWGVAFAIGAISHALLDAAPALWRADASATFLVYPLIPIEGYGERGTPTVTELLVNSLSEPYFLLEIPLSLIALVIWYRRGCPGVGQIRSSLGVMRRAVR